MEDQDKIKEQLTDELVALRQRVAELETAEAGRLRAQIALRETEARYRAVVEDQTELICRFLLDGTLTFVNDACCRYFGRKREELVGSSLLLHIPEEDREFVKEQFTSLSLDEPAVTYEHRVTLSGGQIRWHQRTDRAIFDEQGGFIEFQSVSRDITEQVRTEEQLIYLAIHDALTGLPNRRLFDDHLSLELTHAQRNQEKLVLMLLDLDDFKEVNDTLGHSVGDRLLQAVAHRLTSLLRRGDTVARMGEDEFMLLLPEMAQVEAATEVAQKILEAIRKPFVFEGHELHTSASIGIAIYPDHGEDGNTLMKNAEIAMYRAKDLGRDNYQCCGKSPLTDWLLV